MLRGLMRAGTKALILAAILCGGLAITFSVTPLVVAEESPLRQLLTGDDTRGWEAVGRLNFGNDGFCTGALIAPDVVLTAAHCLYSQRSGMLVDTSTMQFLAGWRNGRAAAYRGVRRAVAHPSYVFSTEVGVERVVYDLALVQLDQPIRPQEIVPFQISDRPAKGDSIAVVSYGKDRGDAPSLQQACHVLARQPGILLMSCDVDFGSSGAPVFTVEDGVARVVSVVSAKAEVDGTQVSLGTALETTLAEVQVALKQAQGDGVAVPRGSLPQVRVQSTAGVPGDAALPGAARGGAKFVRPALVD